MHCNLGPPDAEPVLIRFHYDAHAKFEVAQTIDCRLIYSVFTADILPHVTLTFDLVTFDLEHL